VSSAESVRMAEKCLVTGAPGAVAMGGELWATGDWRLALWR
jgi:hypothetical protein